VSQYESLYRNPATGFARLPDIIGDQKSKPPFFPVSRSEWYRGIARGDFPRGIKLSRKTRVWTWESLHELKARIEGKA